MLSGIKKVEYSLDPIAGGFASPVSLGVPLADSAGFTPEPQSVEAGDGNMLYAGIKNSIELNFDDMTKFAALETAMKNDSPFSVKLYFMDDTNEIIIKQGKCKVRKNYPMAVGSKVNFTLTAGYFST